MSKPIDKKKRRKPTKMEQQIKAIESVPTIMRWWRPWLFEPSHTVAGIASELPAAVETECIWDARVFETRLRSWMLKNKDNKAMSVQIFS
jgi:hypothetical protein